ncbi:MAG: two-component regulator propeller domain-containing protein [Bacteroidota bacterium]
MKLRNPLFAFIFLCFCSKAWAQTYNFRTYSEDQGLPHSYIYCISQDTGGYLYLSTGEGLSIFDGNKFTTFSTREVSGNFVTTHFMDSRKTFWIGYRQNGVSYLKNEKFNEVRNRNISEVKVTQFAEDRRQNLFVSTLGGGIFKIDPAYNLKTLECAEVLNCYSILFDNEENLIAATDNGLFLLNEKNDSLKIVLKVAEFENKTIKQVIPVNKSRNSFWVLVEGEGVYGVKKTGNTFKVFAHIFEALKSVRNNIPFIYVDNTGNLWVSLFGEGLRKIIFEGDPEKANFNVLTIDNTNGLKNLNVQSIFEDFEGNMWFGTFGGGLIEKPIQKFSFFNIKDGLDNIDVGKVVLDKYGNIWMGNTEGICFFNPENSTCIKYNSRNGFIDDRVISLVIDDKGLIWIGTANNGIYTYDHEKQKFENFSKKHAISPLTINTMVQSGEEMVIGTGEGIIIYDLKSANIQFYTTSEGLLHNNLVNVFYDSRHRLWVSSHGSPPYYIEGGKAHPLKNINGLNSFNINAVTEDKNGNIWIATDGDGVFRYDGAAVINYKIREGLASNYCKGIAVDKNNSIWVSHLNGLSEKKSGRLDFRKISSTEGLLFAENNLNAIYKDDFGDLWFGTTEGIVHYNATLGKKNAVQPKLAILRVLLNDKTFEATDVINEKYAFYSVTIDFLAIALTNPDKNKYKYRLLGLGKDSIWSNTTFEHHANYPNLSDGQYTFQVIAANSEGLWTTTPAEIKFTIQKPLWKKPWFYFFLVAMVIFITYMIIMWRTRALKTSQMLLQTKVKQKTFLLQREKEEVEKIKVMLENKNKDITDSINYAKRIQDSLLPPDETLNELFDENYFIFYRPKDIVSGDFYWAARIETGGEKSRTLSLAAVADCTGHGVPGAFLSIVANSFLKQSLTEKFVNNTGEVLDYLNKNITATLNPSSKMKNRISDGMDLAIIAIDYKLNKLHYAGANNSIYIYRKGESDTSLFVLKPTKQAIGSASGNIVPYESQIFDLQAGDTIYMFSDGYADQFGGEKDKKLNYKRFKEILANASEMPVSLQRAYIEEAFEFWQGKTPQTDDVCVMGLKF